MPLLDPSNFLSQLIWLAIFFLFQYFLFIKFIIPSFKKREKERKFYIQEQLKLAEQLAAQAEELKKDYETRLKLAKEENIKQMNKLIEEIKKDSEQKLSLLEKELEADFIANQERIKKFAATTSKDLDKFSAEIASAIINQINNDKVTKVYN